MMTIGRRAIVNESRTFYITKAMLSIVAARGSNVRAMKKEQTAFGERLSAALVAAGFDASPVELEKLLARHGGTPVTPQAISGWLSGKHLPKQANMRALAALLGMEPHVLQYGGRPAHAVSEPSAAWHEALVGLDRLAFDDFLALPTPHRKLVRELIAALSGVDSIRGSK